MFSFRRNHGLIDYFKNPKLPQEEEFLELVCNVGNASQSQPEFICDKINIRQRCNDREESIERDSEGQRKGRNEFTFEKNHLATDAGDGCYIL